MAQTRIGQDPAASPATSRGGLVKDGPSRPANTTDAPLAEPRLRRHDWIALIGSRFGLIITWALMIVAFGVLLPGVFLSGSNLGYLLSSQATVLIVAIAVTIPMAAGEFDLSSSGVVVITVVTMGYLNVIQRWPLMPTVLVALAIGLVVGCVNAFFVVRIGISSLIVTLAMTSVLIGFALGLNNLTVTGISVDLVDAARSTVGGIQLVFFYALGVVVVAWYVFQHTPIGRSLYFTGAGREVARLSGVRVDAIRAGSLIVSSLLGAVAAVLLTGVLGSADPNVGTSYALAPFAAAMLGSTSFTPGRFNILGTAVATYFLATGITGLQLLGLAGWVTQVFYGMALILGVALSTFAARRNGRTIRA
ncbi:ABC transporter permease [Arthrobacter bambusae]|uniref:ABC transporter permease n=1 Tax=Arthrobacter TaxID=1663 RepID=UPI001F5086C3|nr:MULTISPECIES: ABC transporter permease [Arthrobacter]MCI0142462.1 ABC transporter permease [Arthrobacter bambusae]UYY81167.1 ABC transporter permease [Arthrobacter sp. YA7-1]